MTKRLGAALCAATFLVGLPYAALALGSGEMLKLSQTHFFMGKNDVYIAKDAVRVQNQSQFKFILVAKAPSWEVTIYQPKDKTCFRQNFKSFCSSGLFSKFVLGENNQNLDSREFRHTPMQLGCVKVMRLTGKTTTVKYLPTEGLCAPQVERIMFGTYQLPDYNGIPIGVTSALHGTDQLTGFRTEGRLHDSLDTSNIITEKIPRDFFEMPAGFTAKKSLLEVVSGDASRRRAADFDVFLDNKPKVNRQAF